MAQTEYNQAPEAGLEGQAVDLGVKNDVSKTADVAIDFGRIVAVGASDDSAKLPGAAGDKLIGASLYIHKAMDHEGHAKYNAGDRMVVREMGRIWLRSETNASKEDPVHVRYAGTGDAGAIRNAAVTDETIPFTRARYDADVVAGELVPILIALN